LLIGFITALGLTASYDLEISIMLYDESKTNTFGLFFAAFGKLPATLIMVFASMAMIVTRNKSVTWVNIISFIGFSLTAAMGSFLTGFIPTQYVEIPFILSLITAILLPIFSFIVCSKIAKTHGKQLCLAATIGLIFVFLQMILVNVIKVFWGRVRMRVMTDPINEFTPCSFHKF